MRLTQDAHDPEPPPFMGSWRRLYVLVLIWLTVLILIFYGFTRYFA